MQYEASDPEDYIRLLEDDWRKAKLLQLREYIKKQGPDLEEVINYKMLGYRKDGTFVFHLNAQKGYVSLYVGNIQKIDPDGKLLKNVNLGKGCIRFRKSVPLEETSAEEFIKKTIELVEAGVDTGCY